MKKPIATLCVCMLVATACFALAGCSKPIIAHAETAYLANTSVEQATDEVQAQGSTKTVDAKLINSEQRGNIMFLEYYIGKITNCFVQTVSTPVFNDKGLSTYKFTKRTVSGETISRGVSNSISTTKSTDLTLTQDLTLSWKVSESASATASAEVGVNVGMVEAKTGISETYIVAAEVGSSVGISSAETIASSVAKQTSENYDVTKIIEESNESTWEYDMSKYEQNYWYALAFVADVEVYQVVSYNVTDGKLYSTYFVSSMANNLAGLKMFSSETTSFNITEEYQLSPITEINIDIVPQIESKPPRADTINVTMNRQNCSDNGVYDEKTGDDRYEVRHSGYEIGHLELYGCQKIDGRIKVVSNNDLRLYYRVDMDVDDLPRSDQGVGLTCVNSDTATTVKGTNIKNQEIKKGAYYIRITYTDNSAKEFNATNIFDNINKDSYIDLTYTIDKDKAVSKIEIIVAYELYVGGPGFLGIWWRECTNWKCSYTFDFVN